MLTTTITQSPASIQTPIQKVYEYALTITNTDDNDTQELIAAFTSIPSSQELKQWLTGWNSCGYSLSTQPILIRTI